MNTEILIKKLEDIENLALEIKGRPAASVIAINARSLIQEVGSGQAGRYRAWCRCGAELPTVSDDETPYEFCSDKCKAAAH